MSTVAADSLYLSNINSIFLGARFDIGKRADFYAGLSRVQDVGDGRATSVGSGAGSTLTAFQIAQTFPLSFDSPMARLSFRISNKVRWNVGYQYYGYREDFFSSQNFRAHTGYTSLSFSF